MLFVILFLHNVHFITIAHFLYSYFVFSWPLGYWGLYKSKDGKSLPSTVIEVITKSRLEKHEEWHTRCNVIHAQHCLFQCHAFFREWAHRLQKAPQRQTALSSDMFRGDGIKYNQGYTLLSINYLVWLLEMLLVLLFSCLWGTKQLYFHFHKVHN